MKSMMNIVIMLIMIFPRILAYGHHIQPLAPNQDEEYDNHPDSGEDHDEHDNHDDHDNNDDHHTLPQYYNKEEDYDEYGHHILPLTHNQDYHGYLDGVYGWG